MHYTHNLLFFRHYLFHAFKIINAPGRFLLDTVIHYNNFHCECEKIASSGVTPMVRHYFVRIHPVSFCFGVFCLHMSQLFILSKSELVIYYLLCLGHFDKKLCNILCQRRKKNASLEIKVDRKAVYSYLEYVLLLKLQYTNNLSQVLYSLKLVWLYWFPQSYTRFSILHIVLEFFLSCIVFRKWIFLSPSRNSKNIYLIILKVDSRETNVLFTQCIIHYPRMWWQPFCFNGFKGIKLPKENVHVQRHQIHLSVLVTSGCLW